MEKKTPYWWAYLKHPTNRLLSLGTVAASVLLSVPWGGAAIGLGLLALAAVQLVGVATVPGLPAFRAAVDKQDARRAREQRREHLLQEIATHGGSPHLQSYEQMCQHVQSLYRTAGDRSTTLTEREVDQLDELTIDYLRMCLSDVLDSSGDRRDAVAALARKLREVQGQLERPGLRPEDSAPLRQALADYEEAIARHNRIAARRSALDAALVSMPTRVEELHQMVMASPRSGNVGQLLEESVAKLRLAEEATVDLERTLEPLSSSSGSNARSQEAAAQAARRRAVGQRQ